MTETAKKIYIVCPVRNADPEVTARITRDVEELESLGHRVHYPPRDVNQADPTGYEICTAHLAAMKSADEVHVFWHPKSTGSHFDIGMAWALGVRICLVEELEASPPGKSYAEFIKEIERRRPN